MSKEVTEAVVAKIETPAELVREEELQQSNSLVERRAKELKILTNEDYEKAAEFGQKIKIQAKVVTDFFKPMKDSAYKAHKAVCDREKAMLKAFGISVRTLNRWKKDHESFMLALTAGKDQADAKVEKKLYERAIGYRYTEKETVLEMDADGNRKPLKVRTVEKECPPDVLAQMYWLNNRNGTKAI